MITPIPAIDMMNGRCVRLTKGDYATEKVYSDDPVAMAKDFEEKGFRRLHVVDLDGARSQHIVNSDVLAAITKNTKLEVDFGGGIKSKEDLQIAFDCGATQVTVGSLAVKEPETFRSWIKTFGASKFILGADVADGYIRINGWKEGSSLTLLAFIEQFWADGIRHVLCTDISKDGTLAGPATSLYKELMTAHPEMLLIASGGVSGIEDIKALDAAGIPSVVFGKAIYEGKMNLDELARWAQLKGI